ncbi:4-hydroxythreonine-4-phosphate dehydrogenase [Nitrospirillum amazonense]|uniref:4-hydroxythreonine-4-phosphate dehydrogenase n=1 Tax=Nitrospirillum amazonense TaxID=28077 RepID=A0A560FA89_9PROT|nr:4-hydroxythreonine-4-phosphate dehydrogenase PdxA [Nitrospirillum amazonense]TWB18516.1 4-hydroxythreonine-4-phosphate dehydrogenase [Nitrospirillum amazonense]
MTAPPPSSVLPLALTMGEPAGIGGEIALMAWRSRRDRGIPPFFMIDSPERLAALAQATGLDVPVREIQAPADAAGVFGDALPVLRQDLSVPVVPGQPDPANGAAVIASIDRAVALVQAGQAAAAVTNPIQKSSLYAAGFRHPGHTEYLAHLAGMSEEPVMLLEGGGLRVALATIHVALKDVAGLLTREVLLHTARVTHQALRRDFGLAQPRLAVAALNPHAGEGGAMGREEIEIIAPAVATLRAEGMNVAGPLPADTLFHAGARATYDAVICQYHDQGLIPLKTLDFDTGVNITLGLPFIRTSPDHGTALSLAGTAQASPSSLVVALLSADRLARQRAAA